jgi:hypothetical protein
VEADVGVGGAGVRGQLELRDVEGAFGEHIASGIAVAGGWCRTASHAFAEIVGVDALTGSSE